MAADHVAPVYIPFVMWTVAQARRRGITRLRYLSRDGWIMNEIHDALGVDDVAYDLMFVSRRALLPAYLADGTEEDYMRVADRCTLVGRQADHLLWQLGLTREQMRDEYGTEFAYHRIISKAQEADFLQKLFHNPRFTPQWQERCREARQRFIEYMGSGAAPSIERSGAAPSLKGSGAAPSRPAAVGVQANTALEGGREGAAPLPGGREGAAPLPGGREGAAPLHTRNWAMVDVGWLGTSRLMVGKILGVGTPTFYLGGRRDILPEEFGPYDTYFLPGTLDTWATALIESYFSACPWPSTVGYDATSNPIFDGEYQENEATKANASVARAMARMISELPFEPDPEVLFLWARTSVDYVAHLEGPVDLSPLAGADGIDNKSQLVKKLSVKQLANMLLLGGRPTNFDRGSLAYTLGRRTARLLWPLHTLTARLRGAVYKRIIHR